MNGTGWKLAEAKKMGADLQTNLDFGSHCA